jgi:hypothetical protein
MQVIGLDIGGANLKAADVRKHAVSRSFPVWRTPENSDKLREILDEFAAPDPLAVTMTAELRIVFARNGRSTHPRGGRRRARRPCCRVADWCGIRHPEVARDSASSRQPTGGATTWLGRIVPDGNSLLIDVGSTTTDVIPLSDGVPVTERLTDSTRSSPELIYTGAAAHLRRAVTIRPERAQNALSLRSSSQRRSMCIIVGNFPKTKPTRHRERQPATKRDALTGWPAPFAVMSTKRASGDRKDRDIAARTAGITRAINRFSIDSTSHAVRF